MNLSAIGMVLVLVLVLVFISLCVGCAAVGGLLGGAIVLRVKNDRPRCPILPIDILEVKGSLGSLIHWLGFQPLNLSTTCYRLSCIDSRGTIYRAPALLVPGYFVERCIGKSIYTGLRKDRSSRLDSFRYTLPRF